MKSGTLILVRHAKSSWKHEVADHDRPLNRRGRENAPMMAGRLRNWLREAGIAEPRLVSSTARRAYDTACCFAEAFGIPVSDIEKTPQLYEAGEQDILQVLAKQPGDVPTLALFGHNPTFTDVIVRLAKVPLDNLPTCGFAVLQFKRPDWQAVTWGAARLLHMEFPRDHRNTPVVGN